MLDRRHADRAIPQMDAKLDMILKENVIFEKKVFTIQKATEDLYTDYAAFKVLTVGKLDAVVADITYLKTFEAEIENLKTDTIVTDRLIIRDPDTNEGILFAINNGVVVQDGLTEEELKRLTLSGQVITAESITTDKLAANSITSEKILAYAITADKIASGAITADKITAEAITTDKIASGAITADKISVTSLAAISATVGGFTISDTALTSSDKIKLESTGEISVIGGATWTESDGTVTYPIAKFYGGYLKLGKREEKSLGEILTNRNSLMLDADGLYALEGGDDSTWFSISTENKRISMEGDILFTGSGTHNILCGLYGLSIAENHIELCSGGTSLYFEPYESENIVALFYPASPEAVTCGTASYPWYRVYGYLSYVTTSDRRKKKNIRNVKNIKKPRSSDEKEVDLYSEIFDRLEPVEYELLKGEKKSLGLVAQDVVEILKELEISEDEIDLVQHEYYTNEDGEKEDIYGIAYDNFIAMLIHEVQKLKAKVR